MPLVTRRPPRRGAARATALLAYVAACAIASCDGGGAPAYQGQLQAAQAIVNADTFIIPAQLAGVDGLLFVDTGAPITLLQPIYFNQPDIEIGAGTLPATLFGVDFEALPVVLSQFEAIQIGSELPVVGLLGGDLLRHFVATFDYAGSRVILGESLPSPTELGDLAESTGTTVPFELLGGGVYPVSDGSEVPVEPTRVLLKATIEGQEVDTVVDTGASFVVLNPGFFNGLDAPRPMLEGVQLGTVMGSNNAQVSRVRTLRIGDAEVESTEVAVVPGFAFVDSLQRETERPVQALIGATFLREFLLTIDYPARQLTLRRYKTRDHIDDSRFHRVGIFLGLVQTALGSYVGISSVVPGKDAEQQGITTDDIPVSIGGKKLAEFPDGPSIDEALEGEVGTRVTVELQKNGVGAPRSFDLLIEDLLPPF